ncbi:MAG TPA: hypothetical protein VFA94_05970 [Acidimicrobiales bacterium]|nr:hypothetical protein [Acidimicrobiales bacterium]
MRHPLLRRLPATILLAMASVVASAGPAAAHALGGTQPTDYRSTILGMVPQLPGIEVRLLDLGRRVELRNRTAQDVTVLGYQGEPYLRVGPKGVFENQRSPAVYLNRLLPAGEQPVVPKTADPTVAPEWRRTGSGDTVRWRDHRTRWEGATPPAVRANTSTEHVVANWTVNLAIGNPAIGNLDGDTASAVVRGQIVWVPPPSTLPWWVLAAALAVATAAIGLTPRWGKPLAAAAAALVLVDLVHTIGLAAYGRTSLALTLGRVALGGLFSVAVWVAGLASVPALLRGRAGGLVGAGVLGVGVAFLGGVGDLASLGRSQLAFTYAPTLARASIAISLGVGAGIVAAVVLIERKWIDRTSGKAIPPTPDWAADWDGLPD